MANGLAVVKINGKWGSIAQIGNWLIKPRVKNTYPPTIAGNCIIVGSEGERFLNYSLMDLSGKYLIEPTRKYSIYSPLGEHCDTDIGRAYLELLEILSL